MDMDIFKETSTVSDTSTSYFAYGYACYLIKCRAIDSSTFLLRAHTMMASQIRSDQPQLRSASGLLSQHSHTSPNVSAGPLLTFPRGAVVQMLRLASGASNAYNRCSLPRRSRCAQSTAPITLLFLPSADRCDDRRVFASRLQRLAFCFFSLSQHIFREQQSIMTTMSVGLRALT